MKECIIKDRVGVGMIVDAEEKSLIKKGTVIVKTYWWENTAIESRSVRSLHGE